VEEEPVVFKESEEAMHEGVRREIEERFKADKARCYLEITARGFSDVLKDKIKDDIIFNFIKRTPGSEHASRTLPDLQSPDCLWISSLLRQRSKE